MRRRMRTIFGANMSLPWRECSKVRALIQEALDERRKVTISFRAMTRWSTYGKVTRNLRRFDRDGTTPIVVFGGWDDFRVRPDEILEIELLEKTL